MSDQLYDAAKTELAYLNPESPEVKVVGAAPAKISVWEKAEHVIPMGSLNKVNSKAEFLDWARGTGAERFLITYKVDGSSMELIYSDGKLIRAVTRGDGSIGEDVTSNIIQIPDVPKTIPSPGEVVVRGEVVMFKETFERTYSKTYANPRNTANGKVREKKNDGVECRNLNFVAYTIYLDGKTPTTEREQFETLKELGFEIPYASCGCQYDLTVAFASITDKRDLIPYEIDGMVIRVDDIAAQDLLGSKDMKPNGQIAWKFDAAMSTSKVVDIKWQVSQSGRITPVASIEPTNIEGVTITSVSLHNISLFKKLRLFKGCDILISRRNGVIPYLEKNLSLDIDAND